MTQRRVVTHPHLYKNGGTVKRGKKIVTTLNIDAEARAHLDRLAPGHTKGEFLSRLIFEFVAREEERTKLLAEWRREEALRA